MDAAHNPGGIQATLEAVHESFGFAKLIGVVAMFADKDVRGILELLEPMTDQLVVTRNSSPRSMEPGELAALAGEIFGPDRVHRADRLDGAIDLGIGLADEAGEFGGAGVLITGSVVTAGDARLLLKAEEAT